MFAIDRRKQIIELSKDHTLKEIAEILGFKTPRSVRVVVGHYKAFNNYNDGLDITNLMNNKELDQFITKVGYAVDPATLMAKGKKLLGQALSDLDVHHIFRRIEEHEAANFEKTSI